jgi:hypothetical protein
LAIVENGYETIFVRAAGLLIVSFRSGRDQGAVDFRGLKAGLASVIDKLSQIDPAHSRSPSKQRPFIVQKTCQLRPFSISLAVLEPNSLRKLALGIDCEVAFYPLLGTTGSVALSFDYFLRSGGWV